MRSSLESDFSDQGNAVNRRPVFARTAHNLPVAMHFALASKQVHGYASIVKHLVLVTEPLADAPASWLRMRADVHWSAPGDSAFERLLPVAAGLLVRTYVRVDEQLLERTRNLRVVARAGVGVDNIDVASCRARGIEVVYTPEASTQAVVEYVLTILTDLLRPCPVVTQPLPLERWQALRGQAAAETQLSELTLGILGFGRIGRRLAEVAAALGLEVMYNDLLAIPASVRHGARAVPVDALFEESDVVSIHIDGRRANRGFVAESLLRRLRPDAVLINTSRGAVVDTMALAEVLRANPRISALLDVHDPEPFDASYPLLGLPNARLYPHLAGRTRQALLNMSWVVRDVIAVLEGESPRHPAPDPAIL